ncbi:mitochondrial inner membrane protease subunit 2 [Rhodotorula toruloides]|uniref:Mitochondrial inner membrane protease subunit 2 n=1 Tax=Rhodotorula toruloides TaxID=5286 RepID=A0A511K7G1_RHOTO|nr:mitochondrial inner membrane protease subunit 2 [Rhodotorula toruloides]
MASPSVHPFRRAIKILGWAGLAVFFEQNVATVASVSGRSMQPTLNPDSSMLVKDWVVLNRLARVATSVGEKDQFKPGDVVAVKSPTEPYTLLIKRLIALPHTLVRTLPPYPESTVRVPAGHCWIEGDERFHTRDSNTFGPVPLGLIESKVEWIVWPPSRWGRVQSRPGWEKRVMEPRRNFFA